MNEDEKKQRGIDWDLEACLRENPQDGFDLSNIVQVVAVWEGENEGDHWRWILYLDSGFAWLEGWCDYTGWDCQSEARSQTGFALNQMALDALMKVTPWQSYEKVNSNMEQYLRLQFQTASKHQTWSERADDEMGNPPKVELD